MTAMAIAAVVVAGMGLYGWLKREERLLKRVERNLEWEALHGEIASLSGAMSEVQGRLDGMAEGGPAMDAVAQLRAEVGEGFGKAAASYDEVRNDVNLIKTRLQIGPRVRVA
jgi:hypothetical protein